MSEVVMHAIIDALLESEEPSIRYKTLARVLGKAEDDPHTQLAREQVRGSARVAQLLSQRDANGRIPGGAYAKWTGAHWVLAALADLGYPPGDISLIPLREQVLSWLFSRKHLDSVVAIEGRVRRCASQEGNALYALLSLGLGDERTDMLALRLISYQWPDGGWNCDKRPAAHNSSFMESLIPLRALALHARLTGSRESQAAATRSVEVFLSRGLYRRRRDGSPIHPEFLRLHYPCYWHYDILFGLTVMAEAGFIHDQRCQGALDQLEAKRLPDGGFPAEGKYYTTTNAKSGRSLVNCGGVNQRRMNPFVTVEALYVLNEAGRL
ncbi:MAG: hypothetical protein R6V73_12990 [Anaerolineales bacterium]